MENQRKRWGDRRDARRVRDLDELHVFTPLLMPGRADNEAFISETIDITNVLAYLEKKNQGAGDFKYTLFHVIIAAMIRTVVLRPRMNRFVKGGRIYHRDEITAAFVVKKQFSDQAHEALAYQSFDENTTMDAVYQKIKQEVTSLRDEASLDHTTGAMQFLSRLPRPVLRVLVGILRALDYYGRVPYDLIKADPNYATVFLTNLGSIKLNSAYHHLANWGTNSLFVVVGERKLSPFYDEDGNVTMRPTISLGMTIDERIADGYYYAQTIKILKQLLQNPELLDTSAGVAALPVEERNEAEVERYYEEQRQTAKA